MCDGDPPTTLPAAMERLATLRTTANRLRKELAALSVSLTASKAEMEELARSGEVSSPGGRPLGGGGGGEGAGKSQKDPPSFVLGAPGTGTAGRGAPTPSGAVRGDGGGRRADQAGDLRERLEAARQELAALIRRRDELSAIAAASEAAPDAPAAANPPPPRSPLAGSGVPLGAVVSGGPAGASAASGVGGGGLDGDSGTGDDWEDLAGLTAYLFRVTLSATDRRGGSRVAAGTANGGAVAAAPAGGPEVAPVASATPAATPNAAALPVPAGAAAGASAAAAATPVAPSGSVLAPPSHPSPVLALTVGAVIERYFESRLSFVPETPPAVSGGGPSSLGTTASSPASGTSGRDGGGSGGRSSGSGGGGGGGGRRRSRPRETVLGAVCPAPTAPFPSDTTSLATLAAAYAALVVRMPATGLEMEVVAAAPAVARLRAELELRTEAATAAAAAEAVSVKDSVALSAGLTSAGVSSRLPDGIVNTLAARGDGGSGGGLQPGSVPRYPLANPSSLPAHPAAAVADSAAASIAAAADRLRLAAAAAAAPARSHPSHVLTAATFARLVPAVPARFRSSDLQRLYATTAHGTSLRSLYAAVAGRPRMASAASLLALRTTEGAVVGAFVTAPWAPASRFFGGGEAFLWRADPWAVYRWAGLGGPHTDGSPGGGSRDQKVGAGVSLVAAASSPGAAAAAGVSAAGVGGSGSSALFQYAAKEFLAVGGGGGFGLWIDDELDHASTAACATFASPPLIGGSEATGGKVDFRIVAAEVWAWVPPGHVVAEPGED
ncbi:hypothetical protein MMPV_006848 [Pyropia vietnamensis]